MTMTVNEQGILSVRWVLAVDADDPAELAAVLRDVTGSEGGTFALLEGLAGMVKAFAADAQGDQWRATMVAACNVLELDDLD
jgi:hypothetical protein